jgi:predicted RNA-binding protein YlxR (DUF448 family)
VSRRPPQPGGSGPRRTCIGCRQVRPKAELMRLVRRTDGTVGCDPTGPGRGAYVCAGSVCVERALKRLAHAFRRPAVAGQSLVEAVRTLPGRETSGAPVIP